MLTEIQSQKKFDNLSQTIHSPMFSLFSSFKIDFDKWFWIQLGFKFTFTFFLTLAKKYQKSFSIICLILILFYFVILVIVQPFRQKNWYLFRINFAIFQFLFIDSHGLVRFRSEFSSFHCFLFWLEFLFWLSSSLL